MSDSGKVLASSTSGSLHRVLRDSTQSKHHLVPDAHPKFETPATIKEKLHEKIDEFKEDARKKTKFEWLQLFLPIFRWLKDYKITRDFPKDLLAGCTVGLMVIPQGMSYAKLAGLPVQYGLYTAFTPMLFYSLFGTCRQLAVGPVAVLSLMLSSGLSPLFGDAEELTDEQQAQYNILAIQVSLMVGVVFIAMGLLRLGFVTIFLSHAVTSGFTSGAAVIIAMSQVKYIFGITIPRSDQLIELLTNIIENLGDFNWRTFVLGTSCIIALLFFKELGKRNAKFKWLRYAGPMLVTAICIIISYAADLQATGIPIVKKIPPGLPAFTASWWSPLDPRIFKTVFLMVVVGFMESISIARQLAAKNQYDLDPSLELLGLGVANFCGSMFQSYPITGSFSRSAIKQDTGAVSNISGIITALIVMITLLVLTPVFELLPLATFAAIIISGVLTLLDFPEAVYLWKVHRFDFLVWITSCLITMFLGVEIGLGVAIGLSLLLVLYESAYPHTAVLGRLEGSSVYRNVKQYPEAEQYDGIVVARIDAPLYFANTEYVREKVAKYEQAAAAKSSRPIKFVILDFSPVAHIDSAGLHILDELASFYKSREITVLISNPSRIVMEKLVASGIADAIGRDNFYVSVHDAVNFSLNAFPDEENATSEGDVSDDLQKPTETVEED